MHLHSIATFRASLYWAFKLFYGRELSTMMLHLLQSQALGSNPNSPHNLKQPDAAAC